MRWGYEEPGKDNINIPVDCYGQIAQVNHKFVIPHVPPSCELSMLLLLWTQLNECSLLLEKQCTIVTQVYELQHDVQCILPIGATVAMTT